MTSAIPESSLQELMSEAYHLSLSLAYCTLTPDGHYFDVREDARISEADSDTIFSWADGLMHKHYENRSTGHCSLASMMSFDVAAWEEEVTQNIAMMGRLLLLVGEPRRITGAELRDRGYEYKGE